MIDRCNYRLVISGLVNAASSVLHYSDPLLEGNAAKSLMNIAELETAALSGKFRELLARDQERRGAEGMKSSCRDKLSKRRATPRVNWLSEAILDGNLIKGGRTHRPASRGRRRRAFDDEAPRKFDRPPQPNQAVKGCFSSDATVFIYRDLIVFSRLIATTARKLPFGAFCVNCSAYEWPTLSPGFLRQRCNSCSDGKSVIKRSEQPVQFLHQHASRMLIKFSYERKFTNGVVIVKSNSVKNKGRNEKEVEMREKIM